MFSGEFFDIYGSPGAGGTVALSLAPALLEGSGKNPVWSRGYTRKEEVLVPGVVQSPNLIIQPMTSMSKSNILMSFYFSPCHDQRPELLLLEPLLEHVQSRLLPISEEK